MRILAVISDELIGADEGRDWAMLEALVAANGPASIEVRVLAIVNRPHESMLFGMPLGRAVGRTSAPGGGSGYDPGESARHRLERALRYLRGLGLQASGDIDSRDAYQAVRHHVTDGTYDRVLILLRDTGSWPNRLASKAKRAWLRRSLAIPVDALGTSDIVAPER